MLHYIGKYSNSYQQRINGAEISVDHSTCGTQEAFKMRLSIAAFCIAGHHGGIPDIGGRADTENDSTLQGRLKKNTKDFSAWVNEVDSSKFKPISEPFTNDRIPYNFILRFLFSCLVDADYLDTENFMSNGAVSRDSGYELPFLLSLLNNHIEKWQNPSGKLNILRTNMLNECIEVGRKSSDKLFTLTVPTGGGKTISSMAFALNFAVKRRKKRIIYVIPYTSIIEQNAEVFRKIFGLKNVLDNHSNVDFKEIDDETKTQMMLAAENWDSPIVVTTAVQFFESMFSNKPSKCRKIHNIADSVVIFDEAQMLPLDYLLPCTTAIRQLADNYNSAVVLCTATQPNFKSILNLTEKRNKLQLTEICKSAQNLTDDFRRVNFKYEDKLEDDEIALELKQCKQVLCIVNKKAHAQKIYSMLGESDENYHLSTYMYPAHRQKVLKKIKQRLDENKPCRVISTSLIEAGVDIDFPTVYRAISGNRENKRNSSECIVHIFNTDEVLSYQQTNTDAAMEVIKKYGDKIYFPDAIKMYFDNLYYYRDIDKTHKVFDKKGIINGLTNLEFESVAQKFKIIENDTKSLYICTEENKKEIDDLRRGNYSKELFRNLQQYVVNLYERDFKKLDESCCIEYIDSNVYILSDSNYYSDKTGITFPDDNTLKCIFS